MAFFLSLLLVLIVIDPCSSLLYKQQHDMRMNRRWRWVSFGNRHKTQQLLVQSWMSSSRDDDIDGWAGPYTEEAHIGGKLVCDAVRLCLQVQDSLAVAKGDTSLGTGLTIPSSPSVKTDTATTTTTTNTAATAGKVDGTPVTAADYGIQGYVSDYLKKEFPEDRFMGEEDASDLRKDPTLRQAALDMAQQLNPDLGLDEFLMSVDRGVQEPPPPSLSREKERVWILDPIDGTKGLMTGQQYIVGLALCVGGEVVVAIMGNPSPQQQHPPSLSSTSPMTPSPPQVMVAVRGHGVRFCRSTEMMDNVGCGSSASSVEWYDPPRIVPNDWHLNRYDLSKLTPEGDINSDTFGWGSEPSTNLMAGVDYPPFLLSRPMNVGSPLPFGPLCRPSEICCGAQVKYWAVATGQVAGFIQFQSTAKSWDHAPGVLCVSESGGSVIDGNGDDIFFDGREFSIHKGIVCCAAETNDMIRQRLLACVQQTDITGE